MRIAIWGALLNIGFLFVLGVLSLGATAMKWVGR